MKKKVLLQHLEDLMDPASYFFIDPNALIWRVSEDNDLVYDPDLVANLRNITRRFLEEHAQELSKRQCRYVIRTIEAYIKKEFNR